MAHKIIVIISKINERSINRISAITDAISGNDIPRPTPAPQIIAPTTLDPAHPFPFIQNQGKGLFIEMSHGKNKEINLTHFKK